MNDAPRVTVAEFRNSLEASMAQAKLAAAGVESFLEGGVTADMLSYYGTAIQGVLLLVAAGDAERAVELLAGDSQNDEAVAGVRWNCPDCGERVEANFDLCWSCGAERPPGDSVEAGQSAEAAHQQSAAVPQAATSEELVDRPAPAGPDAWEAGEVPEEEEDDEFIDERTGGRGSELDAAVDRAWKSALLGVVIFPLLAVSLLSLVQAFVLQIEGAELSPPSGRKFYGTILILSAVVFAAGLLWTQGWIV